MSAARATGGTGITDEAVARLRARIGIAEPHPQPPHYLCPNEDAFRHIAEAYGDDNPLWWDRDHAATTRWGGVIAPSRGRGRHVDRRGRGDGGGAGARRAHEG